MSRHAAQRTSVRRGSGRDGSSSAADLIARFNTTSPSPQGAHRRQPASARSSSSARASRTSRSAFLRPLPIRVAIRPTLAAVAVIATVAAFEVPNLSHPSRAAADGRSAVAAPIPPTVTSTVPAAAVDDSARLHQHLTLSSATAIRVSRAKRTAPVVPLMKPGQTVPGVWVRPGTGYESSCFCMRWGTMHWGIDLAAQLGAPIFAVGDGIVLEAGPAEGFGNWVVIQHANGDVSIYGHMRYYFVQKGQHVTAGEKIALVGDEGQSTGPHLHFEVHQGGLNGPKIDPVPWLKARGISVGDYNPN